MYTAAGDTSDVGGHVECSMRMQAFSIAASPTCFMRADKLLGGPKAMSDTSQPADFVDVSQSPAVQRPSILGGHIPESTTQKDAAHTPPELGGSVGCHALSTSGSEGVGDDDLDLVSQNPTKICTCTCLLVVRLLPYGP